jgi:lipoate-protein ligase A
VPHREADTRFVTLSGIPVIRRLSGGGAVFHDHGNLNFSFILSSEEGLQVDFRKYTRPVIDFLSTLGVDAKFEGKNDIKINGLKISGNAEHVHGRRVLHHGTLLFESSLEVLRNSLRKDTRNYSTRAVQSNPSPVMNLKDAVPGFTSVDRFREELLNWGLKNLPEASLYRPDTEELSLAGSLAGSKYKTWEWNYAYGPEYHFRNSFYFGNEYLSCRLFVKDGIIWECMIEGSEQMQVICKNLIGIRHMPDSLMKALRENGINIDEEEIFFFF